MIVVGMWQDMELSETFTPLLRALCGGWVGEKESEVEKAGGKNGFCSFDVLCG